MSSEDECELGVRVSREDECELGVSEDEYRGRM